jgi:hypothetical protein
MGQPSTYCVLTAVGTEFCGYGDNNPCARDALRQHGICVAADTARQITPSPYDVNAGR